MRRIVYLIDQPFDDRNYRRFGIEAWIDRNWSVEVWDLTPWTHPRFWHEFIARGMRIREFAGYYPVTSGRELSRRLAQAGQVEYVMDLSGANYCSMRAITALTRTGAIRVTCALGSIPIPDRIERGGLGAKLAKLLARGPRDAFRSLSNAFFSRWIASRTAPGLMLVAGQNSVNDATRRHAMIKAHNFDYDIYLELMKSGVASTENYAVFIDQDYCFHPEFIDPGTAIVTPDKYFATMRNGLREISKALNVEIRIAAHPRAAYQRRGMDCFGEFPIEYGNTAELIQRCQAVVCHDSTAIQFGVLFAKPLIFVTTDELMLSYEGRSIAKVASEFGKSPLNLDHPDLRAVDWRKQLSVDPRKYSDYRNRYIKADGSPEMPLWDIVIDHIEIANC
jgi:hypothetical protein